MNNIPIELEYKIFNYALACKSEQNFYINKNITQFAIEKFKKCGCKNTGGRLLCKKCDIGKILIIYFRTQFNNIKTRILSFTNMLW